MTADAYTHDELDVLFLSLGLEDDDQLDKVEGRTKLRRVRRAVELLEAEGRTIDLVREPVAVKFGGSGGSPYGHGTSLPQSLVDSLRLDGLDALDGKLLVATPEPASLGEEMSLLEKRLDKGGFRGPCPLSASSGFICRRASVRSEVARARREQRAPDVDHSSVEDEALTRTVSGAVRRALGDLPFDEREPIALASLQGLSDVEVARRLRQPEGTIKSRIRSGMRRRSVALAEVSPVTNLSNRYPSGTCAPNRGGNGRQKSSKRPKGANEWY